MKKIEFDKLEKGLSYYIENNDINYKIKHYGTFINYIKNEDNKICLAYFINIKNIQNSKFYVSENGIAYRNSSWIFYERKKELIQNNLEKKTLLLILRNLIDEYVKDQFKFFDNSVSL
jgi:hypothetical protein